MANRVIAAALIAAGSLVAGFGPAAPAAQAQPVPEPQPVLTDQEQIRDVLTRQADASAALDIATAASLNCPRGPQPGVPTFGTDIESTLRGAQYGSLADQISGATSQLIQAMPGRPVRLAGIDDIVVAGDTATADLTMTIELAPNPPQTQITRANLLRQNGNWCVSV
jgi:hypothetical protein